MRAVGGDRAYRRRLMELGFVPGTRLRLVRRVDVGNVLEVELRESRVSLRISEADVLEMEPADGPAAAACCAGPAEGPGSASPDRGSAAGERAAPDAARPTGDDGGVAPHGAADEAGSRAAAPGAAP